MTSPSGQLAWALRYDGYARLAASPDKLERLLRSARNSFASHGRAPDWCGVDLLRGWAFYLARADHHAGGGTLGGEWTAVLDALTAHPGASPADRPPAAAGVATGAPPVELPTAFSTEPKLHRDAAFLAAKRSRLHERHVAPINRFVDVIRQEIVDANTADGAPPPRVFVPYVDPDSGGIAARVLLVLESPAGPAALGSGMLSADNDDGTAKNVWLAYEASGMPRTYGLHWNAVPWYVGDGKKNATVTAEQVERGRSYLFRLLDLAPAVRVVVALGVPARQSIAGAATHLESRGITVLAAPHPSPIPAAASRGASLVKVNDAFAQARALVED